MTVQVLAHRGASLAERENTLAAFRRAGQMGADGVELDVRRTADGELVVHHDPKAGRSLVICETAAEQLPVHIPSLADALDACAGMWVNVEIKNDPNEPDFDPDERVAEETVALLDSRGEHERWLISSFRLETVDRCHQLAPHIRTAWLTVRVPRDAVTLLHTHGHSALHPEVGHLHREAIDRCHAAGIAVNTWTCDDPHRMAELIDWGIDGICTNVPDVAIAVRAATQGR